ncbi:hydrogenase nickel incorporation protein HypB [Labilibacter sediminis]|nr:hydrogenase nickel incorporation protein HypB [Labilibacter sediminis]
MEIKIMRNVLDKNQDKADDIRQLLKQNQVVMFNFISSPGAGKTSLLELLCENLAPEYNIGIIEGDAYTDRDARRLIKYNLPIIQINTEGGCHLDSNSISGALAEFDLNKLDVVFVENVGNLICPTAFDLGENYCIALTSTTEGDDKPTKYPMLFRKADSIILNKIDLIPYTNFNINSFKADLQKLGVNIPLFEISCMQQAGINNVLDWFKVIIESK